ncbi:MAG: TolC family protein [Prevotella sp.]|nr:TolC family protein [Prevotella sp.]
MNKKKKWTMLLALWVLLPIAGEAQRLLTLDSCRAMALRNNKQMSVARVKQEVNANLRQSARTKYLPQVNAIGGYEWMSKEVSILNDEQKSVLSNMGTSTATSLQNALAPLASQLPAETQAKMAQDMSQFAGALNQVGQHVVDGFRTDTRNTIAGALTVTQPLYMGGAIMAANKMADINEDMATNSLEAKQQTILFNIDHAYWQVVSLHHKQKLAESYVELVKKLKGDVQKMIDKGVATKGDGLSVGVRVNEAEIALMEVKDGLVLAKMLVCQLCGLPVDENITLVDETSDELSKDSNMLGLTEASIETATANRPELKLLQNAVDLSRQTTNVLKAGNLPQVLLTGGYAVSNPNIFNGFEKKFGGFWNVGVLLRIPVWNWGDVKYKVRASKGATTMANLELAEARDLVELQVNQSSFRVNEAYKKLEMAQANVANAEENLRMANLGFKEGTVSFTVVMEAQTAWQLAQTKKIDAEIGVKLSQVELQKALGTLTAN